MNELIAAGFFALILSSYGFTYKVKSEHREDMEKVAKKEDTDYLRERIDKIYDIIVVAEKKVGK